MSSDLLNAIDQIRANSDLNSYDEAMTKQAVILRILAALGWDQFQPDEVRAEYATFNKRVDYSLRIHGSNRVFIEVKQTYAPLDIHEEQLLGYAFQEGVRLAVLTNGVSWQFYLPLHEGTWTERKYYTADLKQQTSDVVADKLVGFLSRANVETGEAVTNAEQAMLSKTTRKALETAVPAVWNEFVSNPPDALIELFRDAVRQKCGFAADDAALRAFLSNHRTQFTLANQRVREAAVSDSSSVYRPAIFQPHHAKQRTDFKEKCYPRIEAELQQKLPIKINSFAYTANRSTGVYCTCSREYSEGDFNYWFTFYRDAFLKLDRGVAGYLALGCGSAENILLIPLKDLKPWLPHLRRIKTEANQGWDICVVESQGKWLLLTEPKQSPIDVTGFVLVK